MEILGQILVGGLALSLLSVGIVSFFVGSDTKKVSIKHKNDWKWGY